MNARTQFYREKFGLDISKAEEQDRAFEVIHDCVQNYFKGIQFVLLYYYQGVPSWSWFYRYYYAPLCFDLALFIDEFRHSPDIHFDPGAPWPPAKQLLAILSPINSELLPPEYQHLLKPDSILRHPYDFYPDHFEIDPYGAIWEHQYIAKIPFIDENLLEKAYSSVPSNRLPEPSHTIYFQKVDKSYKYPSTLPAIFEDLEINIQQVPIELTHNVVQPLPAKTKSTLASLRIKNLKSFKLKDLMDQERKSKILQIELQQEELKNNLIIAYCGYPKPVKCWVCAIITPDRLISSMKNIKLKSLEYYNPE